MTMTVPNADGWMAFWEKSGQGRYLLSQVTKQAHNGPKNSFDITGILEKRFVFTVVSI